MAKTYIKPEISIMAVENSSELLQNSPAGQALYDFGGNTDAMSQRRYGAINASTVDADDTGFIQCGKKGDYLWDD